MKIHVLSDLHTEFGSFTPPETDADVVVLAGDIGVGEKAVKWSKEAFANKPVIQIAGNHEFYGGSLGKSWQKMAQSAQGSHVHLLNDQAVVVGGVRFLGCTLWTDYHLTGNYPLAQWDAQQTMNDFKKIRDEHYRKVRPYQLAARHAHSKHFLQYQLAQPFDGPTVVVTHHAPSSLSIHERYKQSPSHLNACYASHLEMLMDGVNLWVHGHTHDSFDYMLGETRVVCNPRGYAGSELNQDFNPALVIEV